jgi:TatD DNase family protein
VYINVHSHQTELVAGVRTVQNLYKNFPSVADAGFFSVGLHPWFVEAETWADTFEEMKRWSREQSVVAIGEAGLDKVCATSMQLQETIFAAHIQWANELAKPLIVHCVKAHAEVMQLLTVQKNKVPVIFHGFNKSKELARQLAERGYYLSFGKSIERAAMADVLSSVPIDQVFLETDKSDIPIQELYTIAASAFQIPEDSLSLQLFKNAATVFGAATLQL